MIKSMDLDNHKADLLTLQTSYSITLIKIDLENELLLIVDE